MSDAHEQHPYSDAGIAATLSQTPFSAFCKLRDDGAAKPLIRGRYDGLCGGDPAQRKGVEEFEMITLRPDSTSPPSSSSPSFLSSAAVRETRTVLRGQVEAYSRSAAGKVIDHITQRTPLALEKSMHFLVEHYLRVPHTPLVYTDPFRIWNYLWDRFRGIRVTWNPQLPPSNASVKGYVDSDTHQLLPTDKLQRESYRRVRWLEFTAAALAVGGAYLCLTPRGCERFMQDKKQFLESMSQCFTDLTVFYRAEQRLRNAEFFSVLLLLYGLNQDLKVEDRASFCRFVNVTVNNEPQLCPEPTADSVNLAQVIQELEKQPFMLEAQSVRVARELIHCWTARNWFHFFHLCRTAKLTPLQRAVVFQSFTYCRYRAVLDLVLPNYYVYPKLRVRNDIAVAELATLLMMDADHCLQFLKAMGLEGQLQRKPREQSPTGAVSPSYAVHASAFPPGGSGSAAATPAAGGESSREWYLSLCLPTSDPLVTAQQLEERCQNKRDLFFPTYPEFFGFRVWHEAYQRFPDAPKLPRPGHMGEGTARDGSGVDSSPAGRGAVQGFFADNTHSLPPPQQQQQQRRQNTNRSHHHAGETEIGEHEAAYNDDDDDDASAQDDDDDYYHDEYMNDGSNTHSHSGDDNPYHDEDDHAYHDDGEDGGNEDASGTTPPSHEHHHHHHHHHTQNHSPSDTARSNADSALLRQFGCPINLMEVLEVYCPPYHDDVASLRLEDADQALFAHLREHRRTMLRRCRATRRRARHWQDALGSGSAGWDAEKAFTAPEDEEEEEWMEKMEQESVSTSSSVLYSDDGSDDDDAEGSAANEEEMSGAGGVAAAQMGEGGLPAILVEARQLVSAVTANSLYAAAVADQEKEQKQQQQQQQMEQQAAAAAVAVAPTEADRLLHSPTPQPPRLALPETGSCTVVPLPDNYDDDAEHSGSGSGSHHHHHRNGGPPNGEGAPARCNSQTSRVTVESPATLPSSHTRTFASSAFPAGAEDVEEVPREDSAETVVPQPASPTGGFSMSTLFPNKPGQQPQQKQSSTSSASSPFGFAGAKPVVPPLQFNTAMPNTKAVDASGGAPSPFKGTTPNFASGTPAAAAAAAAAAPTITNTTTTPTAAHKAPREPQSGNASDADSEGSHAQRSVSSSPMLEYSHLKRHTRGAGSSSGDHDSSVEENDVVDAYDAASEGSDTAAQDKRHASDTTSAVSAAASDEAGTDDVDDYTVSLPPVPSLTAVLPKTETSQQQQQQQQREGQSGGGRGGSSMFVVDGDSKRRRDADAVSNSADVHPKRSKTEAPSSQAVYDDNDDDEHVGASSCVVAPPHRPEDVDVFERLCLPSILDYLHIWTQITHGDQVALADAAQCIERADAAAAARLHNSRGSGRGQRDSLHRLPSSFLSSSAARVRVLSRRAQELFTSAVLRASMSEYGQHMFDLARSQPSHSSSSTATALPATSTIGSLWRSNSEEAASSGAASLDVQRVAAFSRGCSAALIPQYEAAAMLAVEDGDVPALAARTSRALEQSWQRRSVHVDAAALDATAAFANTFRKTTQRFESGVGGGRTNEMAGAVNTSIAAATAAARSRSTASQIGSPSASMDSVARVVFDPTTQQFVVWSPTCDVASLKASTLLQRPSSGSGKGAVAGDNAPVLLLTSTYVLVSSGCAVDTAAERPLAQGPESAGMGGEEARVHRSLETLYGNPKERWLAELLMPSVNTAAKFTAPHAARLTGPCADFSNRRFTWLSTPESDPNSADATPLVARLYQSDRLTHVSTHPAQHHPHRAPSAVDVPLLSRVSLYACAASALSRVCIRSDGGVRRQLDSRDFTAMPPSCASTLALSHAHYTAVVVVDVAAGRNIAVARAQRTLAAVVDSHVPHTTLRDGVLMSQNAVTGVLLCFMEPATNSFVATSKDEEEEEDGEAAADMMKELEDYFWTCWDRRHGISSAERDERGGDMRERRVQSQLWRLQQPVVASVRMTYGDAESAAAAVRDGFDALLTAYTQQSVQVLRSL